MFRFLVYSSILVLAYSCGNESEQKKEEVPDSLKKTNKSLDKTSTPLTVNTTVIYDSLRKKLVGSDEYPKVTQMRVSFQDFYSYNNDIRTEFYKFCGDTEGKIIPAGKEGAINLTNQYFIERGYADDLYGRMQKILESLPPRLTPQEDMRSLINTLDPRDEKKSDGSVEAAQLFLNAYFNDVPPVAAVTILNTFELKMRNIETTVLKKYAEKYTIPVTPGVSAAVNE